MNPFGTMQSETRDSRKDAKHVLSDVEGAPTGSVVISTEGRNLSQIPRLRSG